MKNQCQCLNLQKLLSLASQAMLVSMEEKGRAGINYLCRKGIWKSVYSVAR